MEVELKLLIKPADVAALRRHPLLKQLATAKPRKQPQQDSYFDTPDLQLRAAGAGLRVRRVGGGWIQTLKAGGSVAGGLHSRHEWESPVAGPLPELAALRALVGKKGPWGKLLRSAEFEERLQSLFEIDVVRTVWDLRLADGGEIEFVLDQGRIDCGGQSVPISEIELELKSGDPLHLFDFALALQQDIALRIGNRSKAGRGYALLAPQPDKAVTAAPIVLSTQMSLVQAFQTIASNCLTQIQSNEAGVECRSDPESLHQMRVGLRRLLGAIGLLQRWQPCPVSLRDELDWLAAQLGPARDWDVLAGTTLSTMADMPSDIDIAGMTLAARRTAQAAHDIASAAIGTARYTRLMLGLARWLFGIAAVDEQTATPLHLTFIVHDLLARNQERLARRSHQLRDGTPQARHRLRIAIKKLRYATEFFSSLYPEKNMRRYARALAGLQDQLGARNDAAVAGRLLQQLQLAQPELAGSIGFVRGTLAVGIERDDKAVRRRCEELAAISLAG
ncbi:CHAD domain-containing protein [Actimicrobium antarcticum]|uniref:Inorganic triphosphatase n=1 Tax=Actimicrobium antarcticum TaxID=1051899 RepID=A0ABP7TS44_9BURK